MRYSIEPACITSDIDLGNCLFGAVKITKILKLILLLDMVSHLIRKEVFHIQAEDMVKMLLSSELI